VSIGLAAPRGAPIEMTGDQPALDSDGLVRGGVRTPWVDVPIARTSGVGGGENTMSSIFGSGELFDAATVQRLYPDGAADYLTRFTASLDSAITLGFLLPADRTEILDLAAAMFPGADSSVRAARPRVSG
jgi:hypothetical protein